MNPPIEETLRPETVNEVLLIDRIRELHRLLYANTGYTTLSGVLKDPNKEEISLTYAAPTLHLAALGEANKEPFGLRIQARTFGPKKFAVATYVSEEELNGLSILGEAQLLTNIHEKVLRSTAKEAKRLLKEAA